MGAPPAVGRRGSSPTSARNHSGRLRGLLESGLIALPRDDRLFDELAGIQWRVNSSGKVQLEAKDDTRPRLGRSPDRADAVAMAFHEVYQPPTTRWRSFKVQL